MAIARWVRLEAGIVKADTGIALAGKLAECNAGRLYDWKVVGRMVAWLEDWLSRRNLAREIWWKWKIVRMEKGRDGRLYSLEAWVEK